MRCHSFWTLAVAFNRCEVLLDHNNAQFNCKYRTARAGLNFAHKKCEVWIFLHKRAVWPSLLYSGGPKPSTEAMSFVKCTIPLKRVNKWRIIVYKKKLFLQRQFYTLYEKKLSNLRPLPSITFPQGFRKLKKFGHWISESGGKKNVKRREKHR